MTRPVAVALVLLAVVVLWGLMFLGWRGRARRQRNLVAPQGLSACLAERADTEGVDATYVSTTVAPDWLDRVTVHGLGARSDARVLVDRSGIAVLRAGAPGLFVPAADVRGVRRETMRAGKAVPGGGLVVWDWLLGDTLVATALRPRYDADRDLLVAAIGRVSPGVEETT